MLVLRPAESAVRRLIIIAAHRLVLKPRALRAAPVIISAGAAVMPTRAFQLFDPLKAFDPDAVWDMDQAFYKSGFSIAVAPNSWHDASQDDQPVDAALIGLRLNALMRALEDLPRQARRLVRWQGKRDALLKAKCPTRICPLRPGLPPGWRARKVHEIDYLLRECHGLANDLIQAPDTS